MVYLTIRQLVSALSATLRETLPKSVPFNLLKPRVPIAIMSIFDRLAKPRILLAGSPVPIAVSTLLAPAFNFVARIVKGFNLMEFQFRNFIDFKGYLHIANNVNDEHFGVV
jgi:hypothetical protein